MTKIADIPATSAVHTITPAIAKSWLEHRNIERNRRFSSTTAAKYATQMRAGLWKTTHQGIAFDWDGFLLDGQHRLGAIVLLNQPVDMDVRIGCDPDTFDVLDTGNRRAAHQMINHAHAKAISAGARYLGAITGRITTGHIRGGVYATSATTAEVLLIAADWPELGTFAASAAYCRTRAQILTAPHLAVLAQAARTKYANRIPTWLDGLAYGENLSGADPRLLLRNRFAADRRALIQAQPMAYGLIVKAWNAYAEDIGIGVLRLRGDEQTPAVTS